MWSRLLAQYTTVKDGVNNGLTAGGIIVFLILIGLPAGLQGREPLAPLALPIFLLLIITLGVVYVRRQSEEETPPWGRLAANGLAMGLATAFVFVAFMGFINRWQANPDVNVRSYFVEVTLETTSRMSGVPSSELHANPRRNPLTGEYPEDAPLRTSPMRLVIGDPDVSVFNLGLTHIGGIYGTALVFVLLSVVSVLGYQVLQYIDWPTIKRQRDGFLSLPATVEVLHWGQLLMPAFLFTIFWMTIHNMNYDMALWQAFLPDSVLEAARDNSALLNLRALFNLSSSANQNTQIILSFAFIFGLLVALRNVRFQDTRLPYPVRLGIVLGGLGAILGLVIWRITGNQVAFILPSLDAIPFDKVGMSLFMSYLVAGSLALYAVWACTDPYQFESVLVGVWGTAMLLAIPLFMDQYQTTVLNLVGIYVMLGLGLNIVVGYAGLLDLGYVAFFGIGAYVYAFVESNRQQIADGVANNIFFQVMVAIIVVPIVVFGTMYAWQRRQDGIDTPLAAGKEDVAEADRPRTLRRIWDGAPPWYVSLGMVIFAVVVSLVSTALLREIGLFAGTERASPFVVGLILAALASAAAGVLLGFPVLRLRSDYLAIVTLGFGEIISVSLQNLDTLTGGASGAGGIRKPLPDISTVAEANRVILYLAMIGSLLIAILSLRLRASRLGRAWNALRSDEDIAQAMGINLVNAKLLAFAIGAVFAGIAGQLFAARQASIYPVDFDLNVSINVLSLVIIGGMGSIPGVIVGSIALVGLPEMLRALSEYRFMAFGGLLVVMMLVRPDGLLPKPLVALEDRARQLRVQHHGTLTAEAHPMADEDDPQDKEGEE